MFEFGDDLLDDDVPLFPVDAACCPGSPQWINLGDGVWVLQSFTFPGDEQNTSGDHTVQRSIDAL